MELFRSYLTTPAGLVALAAVVAFVASYLQLRRARRRRQRVVEKPNSHYTSALVRAAETRHRWHEMDLERIHEVNRGEVVRLLRVVDAAGVDALRPDERRFMETMSQLFGRPGPSVTGPPSDAGPGDQRRPPGSGGALDPQSRSA